MSAPPPEGIVIAMQPAFQPPLGAAIGSVPAEVPCLVRVEDDSATAIGRALDSGAEGVIVPLVETAAQAEAAAAASHYPPKGHRSGGGVRPLRDFAAYTAAAADAIAVGVMIETAKGVENAEAIAAARNVVSSSSAPATCLSPAQHPSAMRIRAPAQQSRFGRRAGTACGTSPSPGSRARKSPRAIDDRRDDDFGNERRRPVRPRVPLQERRTLHRQAPQAR